ncbi:MAG: protein kinase domain-containing protein [Hyphomicrobiaceae bacterium]
MMDNLLALPNGTVLVGDYRLERVLGAGGFGITYLAEELALNRKVAVKEYFPSEFAARDSASQVRHRSESDQQDYDWGLERFIAEAQTLARFDHANIVRVFRYFLANNTAYMVLQFEEGHSFRQWIDGQRRAPEQEALDGIVHPLLDALELIHTHDFLHRDIAADNIVIRRDGSPVLIDFGSARGEVATHTKTLSALVKPGYSPFEQYASNGKQQGPWTDIYALAATLYFAVTGARPPDSPTRITADEMVPATQAAKGKYRPTFLAAIDRALTLQIEGRPRSIAVWRRELFDAVAHPAVAPGSNATIRATRKIGAQAAPNLAWKKKPQPTAAAMPPARPPAARAPRSGGQVQKIAALGRARISAFANASREKAAVFGRVSALANASKEKAAVFGRAIGELPARGRDVGARIAAVRPRVPMPALPKFRKPTLPSPKAVWGRLRGKHDPSRARRSLIKALDEQVHRNLAPEPAAQPAKPPRQNAWRKLADWKARRLSKPAKPAASPLPRPPEKPKAAPKAELQAAPSAAPENLPRAVFQARVEAKPKKRSRLRRIGWVSGMALRLAAVLAFVSFVALQNRPAEKAATPTVAALSVATTPATSTQLELLKTFRGHRAAITSLAVSDDGTRIASTSQDGASVIWNPATGRQVRTLDPGKATVNAIDIAGNRLVMAQNDGQISLWNLKTGKRDRKFRQQKGPVHTAIFASKPSQVYSAGSDQPLRIWNTKRGSWRSLRGHKGSVTALAASPDGRNLVSGGSDKTVKLWDAKRGRVLKTLHGHGGTITAVAMAPSGKTFASGSEDESIRIFPDRGAGEIKTLYGHASAVTALTFSPNSRLLASASADHAVKLWNVETGELVHTFVGHTDAVSAVAFMPDGRSLVTASADKTVRIWQSQIAGYR